MVVEFAVCLPLLVLFVLVGMDAVRIIRANQGIVEAAHETSRIVAVSDINEERAMEIAEGILESKRITHATASFDPAPGPSLDRGTPITLRIQMPINSTITSISGFFTDRILMAQATVSREIGTSTLTIAAPPEKKKPNHKGGSNGNGEKPSKK